VINLNHTSREATVGDEIAAPVVADPATKDDTTAESADAPGGEQPDDVGDTERRGAGVAWSRIAAYGILPGLAFVLALGAGFLKWTDASIRQSEMARIESVQAATDSTIALLCYKPATVEKDLGSAQDRLTGDFKKSYASITHDVVIPGSKQKQISAVATVPAAASVSATENDAVVLVFVDQTVNIGNDPPTASASSVKVTLHKLAGRWLISGFDPV
jgi:Mce-associated membrane protein